MSSALITDTFKQIKPKQSKQKLKKESSLNNNKQVIKKEDRTPIDSSLEILRQFDLKSEYGPCIGITRMERWERAKKFYLNPPEEVKDLLIKHANEKIYTECVWHDYNI